MEEMLTSNKAGANALTLEAYKSGIEKDMTRSLDNLCAYWNLNVVAQQIKNGCAVASMGAPGALLGTNSWHPTQVCKLSFLLMRIALKSEVMIKKNLKATDTIFNLLGTFQLN